MKTTAIILAGGSGRRVKNNTPKQFLAIGKRTLLELCLRRFQDHAGVDSIVLVCPQKHAARSRKIAAAFAKVARVVPGGRTRQESSAKGVDAALGAKNVLIHDAARALVPNVVIDRVLEALEKGLAVMPVLPVADTIVRVDDRGHVTAVLDRGMLRGVQTPQGFRSSVIASAHRLAREERVADTPDDCSLILRYGLAPVMTVEGDANNIKITYPGDLALAAAILKFNG